MEPRIGSYRLEIQRFAYDEDGTPTAEVNELAFHEVDLATDEKAAKLFTFYGPSMRGLYTATDSSRLMLSQTNADKG